MRFLTVQLIINAALYAVTAFVFWNVFWVEELQSLKALDRLGFAGLWIYICVVALFVGDRRA